MKILRLGVRYASLVILTAVYQQVVGVGSLVAHVAEGVPPARVAGACGFVAGTFVPVVAYIYEGKLSGLFVTLFLVLQVV